MVLPLECAGTVGAANFLRVRLYHASTRTMLEVAADAAFDADAPEGPFAYRHRYALLPRLLENLLEVPT